MPSSDRQIKVQDVIQIDMVLSGWIHTHGMENFGLPELEIRDVPSYMYGYAGDLLNKICDYMLNGSKPVEVGQTMQFGNFCVLRLVKGEQRDQEEASHYEYARWQVVSL